MEGLKSSSSPFVSFPQSPRKWHEEARTQFVSKMMQPRWKRKGAEVGEKKRERGIYSLQSKSDTSRLISILRVLVHAVCYIKRLSKWGYQPICINLRLGWLYHSPTIHPSRDTEKVEGEPSLRRGLLHGRIYLRTFARMREEGEEARKQVRGKSRQRGTGRDCCCCHRIKVASEKCKSHTTLKVCSSYHVACRLMKVCTK